MLNISAISNYYQGLKISKNFIIKVITRIVVYLAYFLLPIWPFLMAIAFSKYKFIFNYRATLKALVIYFEALKAGPIEHYLLDVAAVKSVIPANIQGTCIKCGNCCLDKKCVFLEQESENEYICGIYSSPLRKFSNCNSFPLDARDIERYSCPSFSVVPVDQSQSSVFKTEYKTNWIRSIS